MLKLRFVIFQTESCTRGRPTTSWGVSPSSPDTPWPRACCAQSTPRHGWTVTMSGIALLPHFRPITGSLEQAPGSRLLTPTFTMCCVFTEPSFVFADVIRESRNSAEGEDDKIYYFFTEVSVEYEFYGKLLIPRIARVCKVRPLRGFSAERWKHKRSAHHCTSQWRVKAALKFEWCLKVPSECVKKKKINKNECLKNITSGHVKLVILMITSLCHRTYSK